MQHWRSGMLLFSLLFLWACACCQSAMPSATSPKYIFRHLDNHDGLLGNMVHSLAQDKRGYIWIGMDKGLQRYDGLRLLHFPDTAASNGQGPAIRNFFCDTVGQRILYNMLPTSIREWRSLNKQPRELSVAQTFDTNQTHTYLDQGARWQVQKYLVLNSDTGNMQQGICLVKAPDSTQPSFAFFIYDKRLQQLWITNNKDALLLFDERRGTRQHAEDHALLQLLAHRNAILRQLFLDSHHNLWLLTWSDLIYRYNTTTNQLQRYSLTDLQKRKGISHLSPTWVSSLLEDNHGHIWISTAGAGLLSYDAQRDDFDLLLQEPGNDLSLRYNYELSELFQDREENIWIGSDRGINIFNPYRQYFRSLGNPLPGNGLLPGNEIMDVQARADGWMVATWGSGIFFYDRQLNVKRHLLFGNSMDKNRVWCFQDDDAGNTWAGGQHGFLHLLNREGNLLQTTQPSIFELSTIRCIQKDKTGNLLFGLHNGKIITWDHQQQQFIPFAAPTIPFPLSTVMTMLVTDSTVWVGTTKGLARFDTRQHSFTALYQPVLTRSASCYSLLTWNDSLLLAGFENEGLYFFNTHTNIFSKISFDYDRPLWSCNALHKDAAGNIWFSTEYDICQYNPSTKAFKAWHPQKGLLSSGFFEPGRLLPLPSGNWLTWTHTELVQFSGTEMQQTPPIARAPVITGVSVFDESLFIDSLLYLHQPLQLPYNRNFVRIEYSAMQFSGVTGSAYYYRLIGIDHDWVAAAEKGYAGYTNLAPGKYRFEVRTGESPAIASLDIVIMAPFWEKLWFRIACGVLLAGIVWAIVYRRFRRLRTEAALRERIANTEMMALRAQMNPHFIFNCLNGIDALILNDEKYQATIYLNKFAMLIRNILDSSRQHTVPFRKDLETLRLYIELEQWRHEHRFTATINTDDSIAGADYKVPPLVIQPYVENAILHGLRTRMDGKGKLTIDIRRKGNWLVYIIEDNGVGRAATMQSDKQRLSHGMEINLGRLTLFNQEEASPVQITDLAENGQTGTRVEVHLKIPNAESNHH
ncbi:MAG: two-component regulator propeller domain-containing protein [Chitinophagaceae bacterium]